MTEASRSRARRESDDAVHEGGFGIARDPGTAVWHTYRPDGTEILIRGSSP